jgi:hypothetical protein
VAPQRRLPFFPSFDEGIGGSISKGGRGIEAYVLRETILEWRFFSRRFFYPGTFFLQALPILHHSTPYGGVKWSGVVWVLYSTVNSIGGVLGGGGYWSRFSVETSFILWARTNSFSKSSFLALSKELLGRPLALFQSP